MRLATAADRGLDARDVERAVHHALELGARLVDVGDEADAEKLCGAAIRALRLRDATVLATRVPAVAPRPVNPAAPRRDPLPERLPLAYVQQRVEDSLRATRLEVLPLVQLSLDPAWRASRAWPELVGACARLVDEGKVVHWAAAIDDVAGAATAGELAAETWLAAVALPYSLCERTAEPALDALAKTHAILARRPLGGGALGGDLGPGAVLTQRDDRELDLAALERYAIAAALLAPLVSHPPPAARSTAAARERVDRATRPDHVEAATAGELALRFVIDRGAIALPRLHRHAHVLPAIAAASAPPLSPALRDRLDRLFPAVSAAT